MNKLVEREAFIHSLRNKSEELKDKLKKRCEYIQGKSLEILYRVLSVSIQVYDDVLSRFDIFIYFFKVLDRPRERIWDIFCLFVCLFFFEIP